MKRDIEFLFEIGSLRNTDRGWRQHLGVDCANDMEHSFRVVWLALIIARGEGVKNEEKIMKMALLHDMAETRTSDLSYVQKVYVAEDEARAARDLLAGTSVENSLSILEEFKARGSIEAKIVKDADNLDIDFEMKELAERGSQLPAKWQGFRKMVRDEKLYTATAKKLWDALQDADPADWHLKANKWLKIPGAGL